MANRNFFQFFSGLENDGIVLFAKWKTTDATSAVSASQTIGRGKGITAIKKSATGKFQFILEDNYNAYLASADIIESTTAIDFTSQLVRADEQNTTPLIEHGYHTAAGAFADPTAEKWIYTTIILKNSTVG